MGPMQIGMHEHGQAGIDEDGRERSNESPWAKHRTDQQNPWQDGQIEPNYPAPPSGSRRTVLSESMKPEPL